MNRIKTLLCQWILMGFFIHPSWTQDSALDKVSQTIRELIRTKDGISAARKAGSEICETDPDMCPTLSLLLARELESLGTAEAIESAIELLESLLKRISKDQDVYVFSINNLANLYKAQGKYEKAEPLYIEALEIRRTLLGTKHPDTGTSLNNLAALHESQGRYEKAEPLYVEALETRRRVVGAKHPSTGASLNNLAGLYQVQGKYEKAEPLYVEALEISRTALGAKHPDTATSLNNIAALYQAQGKYEKAEPLFIEALEIRRSIVGAKHPTTGTSLNNLALLNQAQGKYEQAEPLLVEALEISRTALGTKHPDTGASLNNLAGLYKAQGRYEKAEPLYLEALEISRTALGAKHPTTAASLNNLASLHESQGKYEKAEPLYLEALEIRRAALGTKHPDTGASLNNLAGLYKAQGKYEKAEPLYLEALEIRRTALGAKHLTTGISLNNIALLYQAQGKYGRAEPLLVEALEISRTALGAKHPTTGTRLNNIALLYQAQGKYEKAEPLLVEAFEISRTALGANHPDLVNRRNNLAALYQAQGKYDKAEHLYFESLEISRTALGANHPTTATLLSNLALLYQAQGKSEMVEPLYVEALEISRTALGTRHPDTGAILNNLAELYESQGKYEKVEPLLVDALAIQTEQFDSQLMSKNEVDRMAFLKRFEGIRDAYFSHGFLRAPEKGKAALAIGTAFLNKGIRLQAARDTQSYLESEVGSASRGKQSQMEEHERNIAMERARLNRLPAADREAARLEIELRIRSLESKVSALRVEYLQDAAARKVQGQVDTKRLQAKLRSGEAFLEIDSYREFLPKAKGTEKKFGDYRYGAIVFRKSGEPVLVSLGVAAKIDELLSGLRDMSRVEAKDSIWDRSNDRLKLRPAREIAGHRMRYQAKLQELWKLVLEPVEAKLGAAEFAAVKSWVICPDGPLHGLAWETLMDGQGKYLRERAQVRYVESPRAFIYRNEERATGKTLYVHTPDYGNGKAPSASAAPGMWSAGLAPMQRGAELGKAIQGLHADLEILTGTAASEEKLRKLENRREVVIYTHGEYVEGPMSTNEEMGRVRIALAGAAKGMGKREEIDGTLTASDVAAWRLRGAELVALVGCETGVGSGDVGEGLQGMRRALYLAGSKWQLLSLWTVVDAAAEIWMEQFYEKRKLNPKLGIPEVVDLVQKDFLSGKVKPKRADGTDLGMDHPLLWAGMTLNGQ